MTTYILDDQNSHIRWKGTNAQMSNNGKLNFKDGKIFSELDELIGGIISVDFTSLKLTTNSHLKNEDEEKLIGHLKSGDFLDVETFPSAEFKIKEVIMNTPNNSTVKGVLTFKGEAVGLNFPIDLQKTQQKLEVTGSFNLENISPVTKTKLTSGYDGEPITSIEVDFKLTANAEAL